MQSCQTRKGQDSRTVRWYKKQNKPKQHNLALNNSVGNQGYNSLTHAFAQTRALFKFSSFYTSHEPNLLDQHSCNLLEQHSCFVEEKPLLHSGSAHNNWSNYTQFLLQESLVCPQQKSKCIVCNVHAVELNATLMCDCERRLQSIKPDEAAEIRVVVIIIFTDQTWNLNGRSSGTDQDVKKPLNIRKQSHEVKTEGIFCVASMLMKQQPKLLKTQYSCDMYR